MLSAEVFMCSAGGSTLLGDVMVEALHLGVVPQQIQTLPVGLPQELHPGGEQQTVGTVLGVLSTDRTQEHTGVPQASSV